MERTPDAVALVFDGQHLTYRQFNERPTKLRISCRRAALAQVLVGLCLGSDRWT